MPSGVRWCLPLGKGARQKLGGYTEVVSGVLVVFLSTNYMNLHKAEHLRSSCTFCSMLFSILKKTTSEICLNMLFLKPWVCAWTGVWTPDSHMQAQHENRRTPHRINTHPPHTHNTMESAQNDFQLLRALGQAEQPQTTGDTATMKVKPEHQTPTKTH